MKKISIIIALALIVTIAGTYATWNYTTSASKVEPKVINGIGISITESQTQTADGGTITVVNNNVQIQVDDDGNHNATIKVSGNITVTFTPAAGQDAVKGLVLKCTSTAPSNQYNGADVFASGSIGSEVEVGSNESGAYSKWVIEGDDLLKLFKINGTVTANTIDEYNTLSNAISGATYSVTVSAAASTSN